MKPKETDARLLSLAIEGDLRAFRAIRTWPHEMLVAVAAVAGPLVLRPAALLRVVSAFANGEAPAAETQAWASFVRRGHVETPVTGAIQSIDIPYEQVSEETELMIADIVARLDELGDVIDGEIGPSESARMIAQLKQHFGGAEVQPQ